MDAESLARDYRTAFLRYLPRRSEAALAAGYELGHRAVEEGVSVLDLAQVHHDVLAHVLEESAPEEARGIAGAASEFFLEVLATVDLVQRASARNGSVSDADPPRA